MNLTEKFYFEYNGERSRIQSILLSMWLLNLVVPGSVCFPFGSSWLTVAFLRAEGSSRNRLLRAMASFLLASDRGMVASLTEYSRWALVSLLVKLFQQF